MPVAFDLNCDVGELEELLANGSQARLLESATSVNICCNAHAGSEDLILRTLEMSRELRVGAHPGFPDRASFGREVVAMAFESLVSCIREQLEWFGERAAVAGVERISHVKAHGALYNAAVRDTEVARAIAEAVRSWRRDVILVGLAGSSMLDVFREAGFEVWAEGFADRAYEADGSLRSRRLAGALIEDPEVAAAQAVRLMRDPGVDTICVHSDTPGAVSIARAVRAALDGAAV